MSLLVYRLTARAPTSASRWRCSSCRCSCSVPGPVRCRTVSTSGRWHCGRRPRWPRRRSPSAARTWPACSPCRSSGAWPWSSWVAGAMDNPRAAAVVVELVEPHDITNAVSLNTAMMTGSRIFGPALAAVADRPARQRLAVHPERRLLRRGDRLDPGDGRDEAPQEPAAQRGGTPVRDALRFVRRNRSVWVVFLTLTIVSTFAFNYNVSFSRSWRRSGSATNASSAGCSPSRASAASSAR